MTLSARASLAYGLRPFQRERVRKCRTVRVAPNVSLVERMKHDGERSLVVRGISTCSSVHSCPTCAGSIMARRGEEIVQGLEAAEHKADLCTFTLRHARLMPLQFLQKLLNLSYSELGAGRVGKRTMGRLGYFGNVKSAEQTWSASNGWHPHLHALFFRHSSITATEAATVLGDRWKTVLRNSAERMLSLAWEVLSSHPDTWGDFEGRASRVWGGGYKGDTLGERAHAVLADFDVVGASPVLDASQYKTHLEVLTALRKLERETQAELRRALKKRKPTSEIRARLDAVKTERNEFTGVVNIMPNDSHGVDVEPCRKGDGGARYLAKLGLEIAAVTKVGRMGSVTTWEIARRATRGDKQAIALWFEHSKAMLGKRQLTWSRGVRDRLGLGAERTDAELIEEEQSAQDFDVLLGYVKGEDWDKRVRGRGQLVLAELAAAYERDGNPVLEYVNAAHRPEWRVPCLATPPPEVRPSEEALNIRHGDARERGAAWARGMAKRKRFLDGRAERWRPDIQVDSLEVAVIARA